MLKKRECSVRQVQILFLIFHMIMVAYAVTCLHPYYGSNDEFTLAAIASGAYGSYTWYFIYLHSAFAWILRFFYTLYPAWNWYTLVMYGLIFISLSAIGCTWIRRSKRIGGIMAVLLVLVSLSPMYVEFQYTKTAALVTAAGYILVFCSERKKRHLLGGIVLLVLGSWIRFQAFGMISIVAFGLWLGLAVKAWKNRDWKIFLIRDCLPCVAAFTLVFGSIALENVLVYTPGSAEAHYKEYDKARQQLLDYGVPSWDDYQAEYEELGLTKTDVLNLQNWLIADYDRYTADTFKAIVAFRQDRPFQWEYLKDYLVILALKPLFILSALSTLLWLVPLLFIRKKKLRVSLNPDWKKIGETDWISIFWPYIALLGIYLYFIKIYRVLPIVVTACLLGTLICAWSAVLPDLDERWEEKLTGKRLVFTGAGAVVLTCGLLVRMLLLPLTEQPLQESDASVAFRSLYDTISQDKDVYYAFDPISNTGVELGYSIFEKLPDNYLTNIFTLGGWETESPQIVSNLGVYDQRSLLTSLYKSDRAVLISDSMLEHIMLHLDSIYDGLFITYSKLNQIGNFNLYALSYRFNHVKDDTHTAELDTTYTAENDRYDVFEGSVNMTPEELEGKSVFLWTESKESGKRRIFQGVWQQQDENGLYSVLYDSSLENTTRVRFMIPNLSYPLDDRYEVHIMIRDNDTGYNLVTDNLLYDGSTGA